MTRLKHEDVAAIPQMMADYDRRLFNKTGCPLKEIAARAAGVKLDSRLPRPKVAVIPMTCGQGIIEGFAQSVAGIIEFLGFTAVITAGRDAGGIAEAIESGAEILFMADDDRFVAVNVKSAQVSDNGEATGRGYAVALEQICRGLEDKKVLVIGAGPVGSGAAKTLAQLGAAVAVYDIRPQMSRSLADRLNRLGYELVIEESLPDALDRHNLYFDASPAENIIPRENLRTDTIIAAPGIPLGVQADSLKLIEDRLLHDALQIGVATMVFDVL